MNVEQILLTAYSAEFNKGLFGLCDHNDGNGVVIDFWNVPNVPQPTQEQILALDTPQLEQEYLLNTTFTSFVPKLQTYIDSVAQAKQYGDGVACASYFNSTNTQWKNEAAAFISWRDSVFTYALAQYALMQNGQRTIPTFEAFQTELPIMNWPN